MPLSSDGRAILAELVRHMATGRVVPGNPATYIGYGAIHDALGLKLPPGVSHGRNLQKHGLDDLAHWTKHERHPAVTGLIVDQTKFMPGPGYFKEFRGGKTDFPWWEEQIRQSLNYDWGQFLDASEPTPIAADVAEPPERIESTTYRVLRDTALAIRVKAIHRYACQICGHTIELPDGSRYAEAHHIQPLGRPHDGPDVLGNILCVCPNHHAELDYGVIRIEPSLLAEDGRHSVDLKYVEYHNREIHRSKCDRNRPS